jgi:cytochrome c553
VGEHLPGRRRAGELGPGGDTARDARPISTEVVLERSMAREGDKDAIGRGATLALNCTMCHGAHGMSGSDAPNLAGQYPEVVIKQMHDYKTGKRASPIMEQIGKALPIAAIADLAAYYAYLPKARTAPTTYDETLPALVRVGDPMRNIAPCISCHGGVDHKFGTPWLEGHAAKLSGRPAAGLRLGRPAQRLAGADAQHGAGDDAARDRGSRRLLRAQGERGRAPSLAPRRSANALSSVTTRRRLARQSQTQETAS